MDTNSCSKSISYNPNKTLFKDLDTDQKEQIFLIGKYAFLKASEPENHNNILPYLNSKPDQTCVKKILVDGDKGMTPIKNEKMKDLNAWLEENELPIVKSQEGEENNYENLKNRSAMIKMEKANELIMKFWDPKDIDKYSKKILEAHKAEVWYMLLIGCP